MAYQSMNEHLEPLGFLVGRTWSGEFAGSNPDKPMVDVMRCERALNGNGIRIVHSINEGEYGGETMIVWDSEAETLVYFYFTTSGFYTKGTMTAGKDHYTAHEDVTGNKNGITRVKSSSHVTPDGQLRTTSQYFQDGSWVEGHEVTYAEAPDREVIFR